MYLTDPRATSSSSQRRWWSGDEDGDGPTSGGFNYLLRLRLAEEGEADIWFMLKWLSWRFLFRPEVRGVCEAEGGAVGLKRRGLAVGLWECDN